MAAPNTNPGAPQGLDPQIIAQLHQLTDPLNAQQKSWLGGYLSGLAAQGAPAPAQTELDSDHLLTILYGSQTGNARSIAEELNEAAQTEGMATELISMGKFKEKNLKNTLYYLKTLLLLRSFFFLILMKLKL